MVIQENEVTLFILATGVGITILFNMKRISILPHYQLLVAGYVVLYAGWGITILEGIIWGTLLNAVEHACYCFSMVLMATWCMRMFLGKEAE